MCISQENYPILCLHRHRISTLDLSVSPPVLVKPIIKTTYFDLVQLPRQSSAEFANSVYVCRPTENANGTGHRLGWVTAAQRERWEEKNRATLTQ